MEKPKGSSELKQLILVMEAQKTNDAHRIKEQFQEVCDSLKPANLLEVSISKLNVSPDLKVEAIKALVGLITGFVTKKMFDKKPKLNQEDSSEIMIDKIIDKVMLQHSDEIKAIGRLMIKKMAYQNATTK